jgi:PAS domain S-box-containing protein
MSLKLHKFDLHSGLFNNNHTAMLLVEPDSGKIFAANPAACSFYGTTHEQLTALTAFDLGSTPDEQIYAAMQQAKNGSESRFCFRQRASDGRIRCVEVQAGPIEFEGKMLIFTIIFDNTERMRTEEELKASEESYRTIVETSLEGIWMLDSGGHTTFVNKQLAAMLGYSEVEMLGRHLFDFMDEAGRIEAAANLKRREEGISESHDFRFRCRDGSALWTIVSTNPINNVRGDYIGTLGMITDITGRKHSEQQLLQLRDTLQMQVAERTTELVNINGQLCLEIEDRKRIEEQLRKSAEKYRVLTENMKDVVWVLNLEPLKFSYISPSVLKLRGYDSFEAVALSVDQTLTAKSFERAAVLLQKRHEGFLSGNISEDHFFTDELEHNCKDGSTVWTEVVSCFYRNRDTGQLEVHGVTRDITERRQAEEQLVELNQKLRALGDHLQTVQEHERLAIARDIHDEIGQHLTVLKLDLEWIGHRIADVSSDLMERVDEMRTSIDQLTRTVQRIAADLRPPLLDNLGLSAAIDWHVSEFSRRSGIESFVMLNEDLFELDKSVTLAVMRIAQEALTNVSRHAGATEVSVSLCRRDGGLILEISDNGCGITPEQTASVNAYGLTGMQERARICRGNLEISGKPGVGTILRLTIPIEAENRMYEKNIDC